MKPEDAAAMIADIMSKDKPKARYIISKNKLVTIFLQMLPDSLLDRISEKYFRLNYGNKTKDDRT